MKRVEPVAALTPVAILSFMFLAILGTLLMKAGAKTRPAEVHSIRMLDGGYGLHEDSEERFAWEEFASLAHPSDLGGPVAKQQPEWVAWYNKCEAGLTTTCDTVLPHSRSTVSADQSSAQIPQQLIDDFNKVTKDKNQSKFVHDYSRAPQLNSVLFNSPAAESIRRSDLGRASALELVIRELDVENVSGAERRLPPGTFAFGSEIVKLIWEIMPDDGKQSLPVYDPHHPFPVDDLQLLREDEWGTVYRIDRDKHRPCPKAPDMPPPDDSDTVQSLPINCFYWFQVRTDKPCSAFSRDIQRVWCRAAAGKKNLLVFLVGFHVMKLTPGNPNWIWSTYYWTRETNEAESNHKWNAPWNHFHQMTTTAIREDAGDHAECYSPYLEGPDKNGLKANCLSCHSFAAYAPNESKPSQGIEYGRRYPYPKCRRVQDELDYFRGSVQTGFVWSISTSQLTPGGGQDPATFRNELERVLHERFQSK